MSLVECTEKPSLCNRSESCIAREVWMEVTNRMLQALASFTLDEMVEKQKSRQEAISYSI